MKKEATESVLAVDLGGTSIVVGEVTPDGNVLGTKAYPSDTTTQSVALAAIIRAIDDYKGTIGFQAEKQLAIGIGLVGRVDEQRGIWIEIEPGKTEVLDVRGIIEQRYGLICGIDNDVACATKAEQQFGWGKESQNFIYLNVGTGIAAGMVAEGQYVNGASFNSGEIGHMVVSMDSDVVCGCGRRGCVERIASGLGLHERVTALRSQYPETSLPLPSPASGERVAAPVIFEAAQGGDELALKVSEDAAKALAALIMNLVRVSDPDTIVLGGGVVKNDYFAGRIQSYLNPKTMRFVAHPLVQTKQSTIEVGLAGAALAGWRASKRNGEGMKSDG
ncbi:ROK family protein [Paenibacillus radicis (ex Gao et al. 2016)]|uniref:Sugar kinase n=1 Tax=Paenibacillus radicis (ex Gao et al. 2016) TaxID=1737354 RepID=A0A917LXP2_9BACL|nr:ROK family protein [Paenibacillus radicis (ex Gao et al. 2016)]GGG63986.1 sugar kinase [Paenibacillus radicis (ex Gao et al. 2016)]